MNDRTARTAHRKQLGKFFNEAARQLWAALDRYDGSQSQLAEAIGVDAAMVNRWLYGDRKPNRESAAKVERVLKIDAALWDKPSRFDFEPPAATASDESGQRDSQHGQG